MENKIFSKTVSVDCVFYGFDPEIGLHFYFHFKPFPDSSDAQREREREREREKERERKRKKKETSSLNPPDPPITPIHPHWSKRQRVAPQHWQDCATNPPTDRPTSFTGEISPRTHPPINPPRPPARSRHEPTNWSTHPVSDPLLDRPVTFRSTHLVHRRVAPMNRSLSVPLSRLVLRFWFFCFDFCFLCCLYILIFCNNICLDPKKMWETC